MPGRADRLRFRIAFLRQNYHFVQQILDDFRGQRHKQRFHRNLLEIVEPVGVRARPQVNRLLQLLVFAVHPQEIRNKTKRLQISFGYLLACRGRDS